MTTLSIKIPANKEADVASYIQKIGGEVVNEKRVYKGVIATTDEDEVTHESFFGENIKRVINAFKS
ncbi:MAG: hypothetical protein EOP42_28850 [Sphingobacteriaceae bacterium]|nr:MAG: hypothetical protein EOP42_28850 [Sphingobacteriaceae bacterium]